MALAAKRYLCRICGAAFPSPGTVSAHRRKFHPESWGRNGSRKVGQAEESPRTGGSLSYCPCCGINLRVVAQAIAVTTAVQGGGR